MVKIVINRHIVDMSVLSRCFKIVSDCRADIEEACEQIENKELVDVLQQTLEHINKADSVLQDGIDVEVEKTHEKETN